MVTKSRKIRFFPSKEQRAKIKLWIAAARKAFNATIELLRKPGTKANWIGIKVGIINELPSWTEKCPYLIKSMAIKDACLAISAAKMKFIRDGIISRPRFRSRRDLKASLYTPKSSMNQFGFYVRLLGAIEGLTEPIPEIKHDCRMCYENGRYYVIVPVDVEVKTQSAPRDVVSLDPGVRTFQTFYSADLAGKFGSGDFGRIHRLCCFMDKLLSKAAKVRHDERRRLRVAAARLRARIKNSIDDIQWKVAVWLCKNFNTILIPTFESSNMVTKLRSKTARAMLTWAHFRFKERLKFKATEYRRTVVDVNEAYTSKTCSSCGKEHKIGSKKTLVCDGCCKIDRDLNGARGGYLKHFSLQDSASLCCGGEHSFASATALPVVSAC